MKLKTQAELNAQYQKNIFFLQKAFPDVASRVEKCEFNLYSLTYSIEDQATKDGYFNLKNNNTQELYYDKDPDLQAKEIVDNIQAERDFFTTNVINSIDSSMSQRIHEYVSAEEYIQDNKYEQRKKNKPSKVLCFGSAVGSLIQALSNLESLKILCVIEQELELFKYSLLFVDYEQIASKKILLLAIDLDDAGVVDTFKAFQQNFVSYNYSTKFIFLKNHFRKYIDVLTREYLRTNFFELSFEHYLSIHTNAYHNLLTHPVIDFHRTKVDISRPVLLIMSGPSLDLNIDFIKKSVNKFIIVAVGSSLLPLFRKNIKADICFSMDGKKRKIEEFQDVSKEYLNKVIFIASEITDPKISSYIKPNICYGKNKRTVGHYALGMLSEWGFKNIYTIGNDVCVSEDGKEYINNLPFKKRLEAVSKNTNDYSYEKTMSIKGNFRPIVQSKMKFLSYISTYEQMKTTYFFDKNIYNLSDGAYIDGMTPFYSEDIDLSSMQDINKKEIINIKYSLPKEQDIFSFDIDVNIQKIKKLILSVKAMKIKQNFYSLNEYINYRDAVFMNNFSSQIKPLHDAGGIIRYILFSDNLLFTFLDNATMSNEDFNTHLRSLTDLFYAGLQNVLQVVLNGLLEAKILQTKIQNTTKLSTTNIFFNGDINEYLTTKYSTEAKSKKSINIQTLIKDKIKIKPSSQIAQLPHIAQNILYGTDTTSTIPTNNKDIILIVTYRNNFLKYYKSILQSLEISSIKRVHFHILNTYYYDKPLDDTLFSQYNLDVSISIQNKFVFFTHLFHYLWAVTYDFVSTLIKNNNQNIILLDIQSLIFNDFSSITKTKSDFAFYKDSKPKKEILFIRSSKVSEEILQILIQNAKLNIYINATPKELDYDLELIEAMFEKHISYLPQKYCDSDFIATSHIWIKPPDINSARFENKKIYQNKPYSTDNKSFLTRTLISSQELAVVNNNILDKKANGIMSYASIQDYNGFIECFFKHSNQSVPFLLFMSLGDDLWVSEFLKNQYYNQTILSLWSRLVQKSNNFIIDANSYNGIFSIISHYYFKDTITLDSDSYQYVKTKINLKTNSIPLDAIYLDDKEDTSTIILDKVKQKHKDIISIFKANYSDKVFKTIKQLIKSQKQPFDIILYTKEGFSKTHLKNFKDMGYEIFYINEYNHAISKIIKNNTYVWLSKNINKDILEEFAKDVNE